jgi:proton glutamate symport protein
MKTIPRGIEMKKLGLAGQIFVALILGIVVGALVYGNKTAISFISPIGDIFIHLIKMIVMPIVIAALVVAVAGVGDIKKLGKIGGKTLLYFEIITTIAIGIGLLSANLFHPGSGVDMSHLAKTDISAYKQTAASTQNKGFAETIVHIFPQNVFASMAQGDLLPIIFFSVLFGLGVAAIGEKGKPVLSFFNGVLEAMFWVTNQVMKTAPFGVFALIAVTVAKFGVGTLLPLGKLVLAVYITVIFFTIVILGINAKLTGTNIFTLIKILKEELIISFTTASSEAVLPNIMKKMEEFGCPKAIVSFVIPTGYTFNLTGSAIYQALASLFVAQMYNVHMSLMQQITLLFVLMMTSKGMAGVPGASFVVVLATLGSMGLPLEGIALIAGIDRILDMIRSAVNVLGNSLAAITMAKWEGEFDKDKAQQYVSSEKESNVA